MKLFHDDVLAFHRAMNLTIGDFFRAPKIVDAELRCRLIDEEIWETVEKGFKARNLEQVIDGLCDSMYVAVGAAITFGIDLSNFIARLPDDGWDPWSWDRWEEKSRLLLGAKRVAIEAIRAGHFGHGDADEAAPALAGLVATIGHVAAFYSIPLHEFWVEVQRANMAKVGGPVRADGKRLKPDGWRGPDHMPLILKYWPEEAERLKANVSG